MTKKKPQYKRILLKLSGEALTSPGMVGVDPKVIKGIAEEIQEIQKLGVQIAIVVGGGNFFRGANETWMERATADYIGMLATVINALVLQGTLERLGVFTRVQTAIQMQELAEPYIPRKAIRHLEKGRVVIFAAGTGNPYFSTDTAAALRAMEIKAEIIMKATKVDGVYSADPKTNAGAVRYKKLKYMNVLKKNLRAMDATATSLCMDNKMPIVIFNLFERGNIKRVVMGEDIGTFVR